MSNLKKDINVGNLEGLESLFDKEDAKVLRLLIKNAKI
ncbi:hypothetical protein T190115A13A_30148 [Tenacibaculum sp. 190524A02b]|uniref:Uncharacterized protein n=1 Tax=Tenacibaculum vairaonense TaxID=3137860 RepID=A0ABP1FA79_9FLAO